MKLYDIDKKEDGTVVVTSELTPEEMKALLHIGFMACIQQGVMIASIAERMGMVDESSDGGEVTGDDILDQFDGITYEGTKDGD